MPSAARGINVSIDRNKTTPLHLPVFYQVGSHCSLDKFPNYATSPSSVDHCFSLSSWPSCTLAELSHLIVYELAHVSTNSKLLPEPLVGTRLSFRLVYPDPRAASISVPDVSVAADGTATRDKSDVHRRYISRDIGSVVVGGDGRGRLPLRSSRPTSSPNANGSRKHEDYDCDEDSEEMRFDEDAPLPPGYGGEPDKTLDELRFVTGDFLSVAILPPDQNGEVVGPSAGKPGPSAPLDSRSGSLGTRFDGSRRRHDYGGEAMGRGWQSHSGGRRIDGPRDRYSHRDRDKDRGRDRDRGGTRAGAQLPQGDWRRGERLPPIESRNRGREQRDDYY